MDSLHGLEFFEIVIFKLLPEGLILSLVVLLVVGNVAGKLFFFFLQLENLVVGI